MTYNEGNTSTLIEENIDPGADTLYYYQPGDDFCMKIALNLTGDTQLSDYLDYVSSNISFVDNVTVAWDTTGYTYQEYKYYDTLQSSWAYVYLYSNDTIAWALNTNLSTFDGYDCLVEFYTGEGLVSTSFTGSEFTIAECNMSTYL